MGYFQVMMKGRNSVHGSRHLRPSWGDFTQPFRVSWLCWWCVAQGGRLLSNPQPPTSPAVDGSRRTLPDLVVGASPLHNPAARSKLETAPREAVFDSASRTMVRAARPTDRPSSKSDHVTGAHSTGRVLLSDAYYRLSVQRIHYRCKCESPLLRYIF